jgi:hypothetical protein
MKEPPTNPRERKIEGGLEYMWCPYHRLWSRHRPSECRTNPATRGRITSDRPSFARQPRRVEARGSGQRNRQHQSSHNDQNDCNRNKNDRNRGNLIPVGMIVEVILDKIKNLKDR